MLIPNVNVALVVLLAAADFKAVALPINDVSNAIQTIQARADPGGRAHADTDVEMQRLPPAAQQQQQQQQQHASSSSRTGPGAGAGTGAGAGAGTGTTNCVGDQISEEAREHAPEIGAPRAEVQAWSQKYKIPKHIAIALSIPLAFGGFCYGVLEILDAGIPHSASSPSSSAGPTPGPTAS